MAHPKSITIKEAIRLCEKASDLQTRIEFAKRFKLPYKDKQRELNEIYKILDREAEPNEIKSTNRKNVRKNMF